MYYLKYYNTIVAEVDIENLTKEEKFIYKLIPTNSRKKYGNTPKEIVKNYITGRTV